jgi:hypothetical protein
MCRQGYPIPSIQNPIIIPQARLRVLGIKKASYSLREIRLLLFQDVSLGISNPFHQIIQRQSKLA